MALDLPGGASGRALVLLGAALALAAAGHAAWWVDLDASPQPFLDEAAATEKERVEDAFPNATPPVVRVVAVADADRQVLEPETLNALAGLRNQIATDPTVAPALDRQRPLTSVLDALDPYLEGPPGTWNASQVDAALEQATEDPDDRRLLAAFLDADARLDGADSRAEATVLVVRLAPGEPGDRTSAQARIQAIANDASTGMLEVHADAPALHDAAARSSWSAWTPLATLALVPAAAALVGVRPRQTPWLAAALAGAAGLGLLAGLLADHASPSALAAAYGGATLGASTLVARGALDEAGVDWTWALPALPVAVAIGWAPAGLGALALVATVAALGVLAAQALHPGTLDVHPRFGLERARAGLPGAWPDATGPALAALLLVVPALTLGLPAQALGGWQGGLSEQTPQGQASTVLHERFGPTGPGGQLVVAAWGPVDDPAFLAAVDETGNRLRELTLTTREDLETILTLGEDWAHNDTDDPQDRYDPTFSSAWNNATDERGVPTENVTALLAHLHRLDPDATDAHLLQTEVPPGSATLLSQRVRGLEAVPEPVAAVQAALTPLVAASDEVAQAGNALDDARASRALVGALVPLLGVLAAAGAVAGALEHAHRGQGWGRGALVGGLATAPALAAWVLVDPLGVGLRPGTLLAGLLAAGIGLAVASPAAARASAKRTDPARTLTRAGLPALGALLAGAIALGSAPTPALAAAGAALGAGGLAGGLVVALGSPGIVAEARRRVPPSGEDEGPARAQLVCPTCERSTARAAERCASCGRWNVREACPAHPDAIDATCRACGATLDDPRFR